MKLDKGLIAGSSTLLVLSLLEKEDMYGYQMITELSRRSNDTFQMKEGTLYPILHALEKGKYLSSYQQEAPTRSSPSPERGNAMGEKQERTPAEGWLDKATAGIRFGPDRKEVRRELEEHLEDKALDFQRIFPGLTEDEAKERAAAEMGDPEEIGKELAKIHRPWLGYLWRASQVLLGLVLLSFLAEVGTLAPHAGIRSDREAEPGWVVEAAFVGQEPVRINNYTLWVEEAALIQGMGELHITWRAASPRFWEMPDGEFSQAWTAVDDRGTVYTSIWDRTWDGERVLPYVGSVQFTGALVWSGEQTVYGVPQEAQWIQINIETGEGTIPVVLEREETQ